MVSPSTCYDEQINEVQEGVHQMNLQEQAADASTGPRYPPNGRALRSHIQPKSKSDDQWLQDMCFLGGLEQFGIIYGFGPDEKEAARRHLEWHKYKQQKAWEELRQTKAQAALRKLISENYPLTKDTAEVPAEIPGIPKPTKEELVHEAVLWHENFGHRSYINVLRASGKVVNGLRISDFTSIGLKDMLCCQACTFAGRDPFDPRREEFLCRPKFTEQERQKVLKGIIGVFMLSTRGKIWEVSGIWDLVRTLLELVELFLSDCSQLAVDGHDKRRCGHEGSGSWC